MSSRSRKGPNWRSNPAVSVHVIDAETNAWVQVRGTVEETRPDDDLAFIDRLSQRYRGSDYHVRVLRREIFVVRPQHVRSSAC